MRIAILCFGIGTIANVSGMEKVFVDMANAFAEHGHEVWSVWNDGPGIAPFYKFNESVDAKTKLDYLQKKLDKHKEVNFAELANLLSWKARLKYYLIRNKKSNDSRNFLHK